MTTLAIGQPLSTDASTLDIDAGLDAGLHRFRLEVVDDSGNTSQPSEIVVQISSPLTAGPASSTDTSAPSNTAPSTTRSNS